MLKPPTNQISTVGIPGVSLNREVVDFACGEHHVICVTSEGQLFEWGDRSWLEPHRVLPPQIEDEESPMGKSENPMGFSGKTMGNSTSIVNLPEDINPNK